MTTWNFGEFRQDVEPSMDSLGAFNNLSLKRKGNCSVDLQLGRVDDSIGGLLNAWSVPQAPKKMSEARLTRRARKTGSTNTNASCLVEGCKSDLSNSREYHKRHKVCEIHAKTPVVMVAGQQQRFCQQCSRFHLLKEFDEVKRSCRKRLDGHNRRRRKVQPDALSVSSASIFHGHYQGGGISSLPKILTSPEASFSGHSLSPSFVEHHQPLFPLTSGNHRIVNGWQPLPNMIASSHSNRALSLLSLTNPSFDINTMGDIVQAADTLSTLNSGLKHYSHGKFLSDSGSYNEFFCSENSWRTSGSFPILEKEYHLENTNSVSVGEVIEPFEVAMSLASAQTLQNSSPPLLTLPNFWPG